MKFPLSRFRKEPRKPAVEAEDGERRTNSRRPLDAAVAVLLADKTYDCRLSDVGPGGAFLTPRLEAAVDDVVVINIPSSRISATARVRRVEADGLGIAFDLESDGAIVSMWSRGVLR